MSKLLYYFFNLRINELKTCKLFDLQNKKIINIMNSCCTLSHDNAKYIYITSNRCNYNLILA